jgi:hypothetical protein
MIDSLIQHLTKVHSVNIEQYNFSFRNMEEFEAWRTQEGREVDYAYTTSVNRPNGEKSIQGVFEVEGFLVTRYTIHYS